MRGGGWWGDVALDEDEKIGSAEASHVIRRTMRMLRPYRGALLATIGVLVLYTICTEAGPLLLKVAIDKGIAVRHPSLRVVEVAAGIYVGSALLMALTERAQILMINRVGESFLRDLRNRVFRHILSLSMSFFDTESTGRLVSRMTQDIDALEMLVQQGLLVFVVSGLLFVTAVAVMLVLSPLLFLLVMLLLPWIVQSSRKFRRESNAAYLTVRDRISQTLSSLQESISGVRVIQAFGREAQMVRQFRGHNQAQLDANVQAVRISARYFPIIEFTTAFATAAIVGVGGLLAGYHRTTIGTITAFILFLNLLINPIQQISQLFNLIQQSGAALFKLYGLLDTKPAVAERPGAVDLPAHGDMVLEGVSFAYRPGESDTVLSNVTLSVPWGQRIALVGPTGAGKSTVAKLMARFYDPTVGRVTYGGVDLRDATMASLRERVAVVPQEGFLFHGTIMDNVRLGREGATDEEVRQALRLIGAESRFAAFPDGLETEVRERGGRLSAGERQLVSLARAALANPDVLILDEATSNLDPGTESDVEEAMSALMKGRTVVVIAHRLSTAERADRVAVVDAGQIQEVGTHHELIAGGGRYAALYASWAGDTAPATNGSGSAVSSTGTGPAQPGAVAGSSPR
ncbi:MAG TPA: ABC transporter ATP-binding protein [Acidimicrobiales bacterium]|nr:ABC transporter ATP-binding protein [Acidimicrobiales bacterium]